MNADQKKFAEDCAFLAENAHRVKVDDGIKETVKRCRDQVDWFGVQNSLERRFDDGRRERLAEVLRVDEVDTDRLREVCKELWKEIDPDDFAVWGLKRGFFLERHPLSTIRNVAKRDHLPVAKFYVVTLRCALGIPVGPETRAKRARASEKNEKKKKN